MQSSIIHNRYISVRWYAGPALLLLFSLSASAQQDTAPPQEYREPPAAEDSVVAERDSRVYFREKDGDDSFALAVRRLPAEQVRKMKSDKAFWYADAVFKKKKEPGKAPAYTPLSERSWFQTLLWFVIVGGFAAALIWYLAGSQVGLFRRKAKSLETVSETDELPEDIFAIRYQQEIERAAGQGNYRLAVRLLFLRLLRNLAERNIIRYQQDKTNFDYLLQLRSTAYYTPFFRLTRHYEYSWYGHFEVREPAYRVIRGEFEELENEISK